MNYIESIKTEYQKLGFLHDVFEIFLKNTKNTITRPKNPVLVSNPTSTQAEEFAKELKVYEENYDVWKKEQNKIETQIKEFRGAIKEFILEETNARKWVPSNKIERVWEKAYYDNDSYDSIFSEVDEIVFLFKP